jgi:lipopolysaccharide export system permease protein
MAGPVARRERVSRLMKVPVVSTEARCTMRETLRLLDRHIFWQVLVACAAAVGFFTFVVVVGNALKDHLLSFLLSGRMSPGSALRLLALLAPYAVMYALPMGVLCGVLLVLGRLSAESEITAMRAAGISVVRLSAPIYVFGALGAVLALAINLYYMPQARTKYYQEFVQVVRTDPIKVFVPKTFVREFSQAVVYVGSRDGPVLRDVWVWQLDREQRVSRLYRAQSGRLDFDPEANELIFTPELGTMEVRDPKAPENFASDVRVGSWDSGGVRLSLDGLFGQRSLRSKPEWLTPEQLNAQMRKLDAPAAPEERAARAKERMKLQMVLQDKFAMAIAVLSFAVVAVPLGIKVSRRETSANLGVAVALALAYYFLTVVVKWLDARPELRPDLLVWAPNLIFLAAGLWLTRRVQHA